MSTEVLLSALEPAPAPKPEGIPPIPKVLILEEDGALREATGMLLESAGYCVLKAASLSAALDIAREDPGIEVLLVEDPLSSGMIGTRAIASMRQIVGSQLKALLITQHISASLRALEQDGYVRLATTPIGADALVATLQALRQS